MTRREGRSAPDDGCAEGSSRQWIEDCLKRLRMLRQDPDYIPHAVFELGPQYVEEIRRARITAREAMDQVQHRCDRARAALDAGDRDAANFELHRARDYQHTVQVGQRREGEITMQALAAVVRRDARQVSAAAPRACGGTLRPVPRRLLPSGRPKARRAATSCASSTSSGDPDLPDPPSAAREPSRRIGQAGPRRRRTERHHRGSFA